MGSVPQRLPCIGEAEYRLASCSVHKAGGLSSLSLSLEAWRTPPELQVFSAHWELRSRSVKDDGRCNNNWVDLPARSPGRQAALAFPWPVFVFGPLPEGVTHSGERLSLFSLPYLETPFQIHPEACLLVDSRSCQVGSQD